MRKRHQDFVTVVGDIEQGSLLDVINSHRSADIIEVLSQQPIEVHEQVEEVSIDMWGGFSTVITQVFPNAILVYDQRLRRHIGWSQQTNNDLPEKIRQKLLMLPTKVAQFNVTFELLQAYRANNQVDQSMNYQERILYTMQDFHSTLVATRQGLRSMAVNT